MNRDWDELTQKLSEKHKSSIITIENTQNNLIVEKEKNIKKLEAQVQMMRVKRESLEKLKIQKRQEISNSNKRTKQFHHFYQILKSRLQELDVVLLQEAQIQKKLEKIKQNPTPALLMTNKSQIPMKPPVAQQSYDYANPTPIKNTSVPYSAVFNSYHPTNTIQQPLHLPPQMSVQLGGSDNSSGSGGGSVPQSYVFSHQQSVVFGQSSNNNITSSVPFFSNPITFLKKTKKNE